MLDSSWGRLSECSFHVALLHKKNSEGVIQDHSHHGTSKKPMNP